MISTQTQTNQFGPPMETRSMFMEKFLAAMEERVSEVVMQWTILITIRKKCFQLILWRAF